MKILTILSFISFIFGSIYFTNVGSSQSIPVLKSEEDSLQKFIDTFKLIKNLFTTCTACDTVSNVIQDKEAIQDLNNTIHSYCNDVNSKIQKICHNLADKMVISGLEYLQKITVDEKCQSFCGENEKPINEEFVCETVEKINNNPEFFISILEDKVSSVCQSDSSPEKCLTEFKKWKPLISGVFHRIILRIAREIDPVNYCKIDLETIPKSENVLNYPRLLGKNQLDSGSCVMCEYLVESACEMITGEQYRAPHISLMCFVYSICMKVLYKTSDNTCPPPFESQEPHKHNCSLIAQAADTYGFSIISNYTNYKLWPKVCKMIDKNCEPNPDVPMCQGAPPVPNPTKKPEKIV